VDPGARRPRGARPLLCARRTPDAGAATDLTAIVHTRDYLETYEKIVTSATDAAEADAALLAAYPDAGLKIAASLGTKVAKGEMTWG
jgi:hypothetical protein